MTVVKYCYFQKTNLHLWYKLYADDLVLSIPEKYSYYIAKLMLDIS